MENRRDTLRVLLDTSFILPSLGIGVGDEVSRSLKQLEGLNAEIYYSDFSILESLWIAARLRLNGTKLARFREGLRSIIEGGRYRRAGMDDKTFSDALELYMSGHRDLIDNILYACSVNLGLKLLTLDRELEEFIREEKLPENLLPPSQLTR
ncbi:MAG: PIN domain-containing protein [Candidatus Bathyarchaeia archaeon]